MGNAFDRGGCVAYPIERKLVVAVASSALFDLSESHEVWNNEGPRAYEQYQLDHIDHTLEKGVAFPFIRRFLGINDSFPEKLPVEVVLLSKNSPTTGRRVFRSIKEHGLGITRGGFMDGKSPYPYIPAFNASLFLSASPSDVRQAIEANYPAGTVMPGEVIDDPADKELRIAFDFDGVLGDDESEGVFRESGLEGFVAHETEHSAVPHNPGPLADLFQKLSFMQKLEQRAAEEDRSYQPVLRIAIITARNAPAHERMITTLEDWGVTPDETFLLGGMAKSRVLDVLKPHVFFDDQKSHLESSAGNIPMVHIPFGVANLPTK